MKKKKILKCISIFLYVYFPAREHWNKHVTTGDYYQLNTQTALTWPQAEASCKQQVASLLTITDPHQQAYLSGKEHLTLINFFISLDGCLIYILQHTTSIDTYVHHAYTLTALLATEGSGQGGKFWTGLIQSPEHGWQWSNGRPYRYLNWDSGKFFFHFNTLCCYSYNAKITVSLIYPIPSVLYHFYYTHNCASQL